MGISRRAALAGVSVCVLCWAEARPLFAQAAPEDPRVPELMKEVGELKAEVHALEDQIAKLNAAAAASAAGTTATAAPGAPSQTAQAPVAQPTPVAQAAPTAQAATSGQPAPSGQTPPSTPPAKGPTTLAADVLKGMTINFLLDTYYEYNTDDPIGRVNRLRAYDVSSNNFSLNQADIVLESAPDVANGKRWGVRLDLQFGQATETLQGNPANELRPEIYRNIFQAYGTYVIPVGMGLTVDFGKWASSLGYEGNYTKDQLNYSRSYWFNFLPFYHAGLRAKYQVNNVLGLNFWVTNGTQQTEAFNNFKDQMYGVVLTPTSHITWTINYYRGQEHPDVLYLQNLTSPPPNLPNQQGTFFEPIPNPATGLLNIGDSYATWQATQKLMLGGEADFVEQKLFSYSTPQHAKGGAVYFAYQLTPKVSLAARGEYMDDEDGLFSGEDQILKEMTFTVGWRPEDGFLLMGEFRRDWSNKPYFYGDALGVLLRDQPTIGFGAVWWFGQKQGGW
ncbi:MAG: outer membrane beta-barrel protein [Caulobacteraceae bacterium]|nr:outer membrane beta-barrel protein [Caulobacteraceae bacterium]